METPSQFIRILAVAGTKIKKVSEKRFTASQYAYFLTLPFIFLTLVFSESNLWFHLAAFLAFLGILRELVLLFKKLWSSVLGKAAIVLFYGLIGNLAFAYAALNINAVTGVEPSVFIYTLSFTTLLLLPFWITICSVLLLSFSTILASAWMLIGLGGKLFGARIKMHWEDEHYPVFTMLLRVVLIPFVLYAGTSVGLNYTIGISTDGVEVSIRDQVLPANEIERDIPEKESPQDVISTNDSSAVKSRTHKSRISSAIAHFIWTFEAYTFSVCVKEEEQKSVIIDDFAVLLISENEEESLGYKFEVKECIPVYKGTLEK